MRERAENLWRTVCFTLAAGVALRLTLIVFRPNPLSHLEIPSLPTLEADAKTPTTTPALAARKAPTNAVAAKTNSPKARVAKTGAQTNPPAPFVAPQPSPPPLLGGMMPGMASGGPGKPPAPLSRLTQARIARIVDGGMLGPLPRPLPMALLGIAGQCAFLRAADGQTGLAREGDSVGGLKLVRIGINRVLVEEAGVKKELTIFEGVGGNSLMAQ